MVGGQLRVVSAATSRRSSGDKTKTVWCLACDTSRGVKISLNIIIPDNYYVYF